MNNKLSGRYRFPLLLLFFCIIGTQLSAQFTGGNGAGFAVGAIGSSGAEVLLPIKLILFDAQDDMDSVKIVWETATETNNDHFTVEKSINGNDWVVVKTIKGAGNSDCIRFYETFDNTPFSGLSYYHLKQTDYDGKFTFSKIVSVYKSTILEQFSVFPNPAHNELVLNIKENMEMVKVTIYNVYGELTWSSDINTSLKEEEIINMSSLKAGGYIIQILSLTDKNKLFSCRFIKTE